ncbi:MAG: hypothetical protein QOE90_233 [Thermoplasmata archaeon]|jgi:hypothetical protein|nr:hypothetical protein [Thermoplasmata archaeon]
MRYQHVTHPLVSLVAAAALLLPLAPLPTASAATGSFVAQVSFAGACSSGVGVGIAFDGTDLWYSCYAGAPDLYRASATTGAIVASYNLCDGLGALSYDRSTDTMWAGWGGGSCGPGGSILKITHNPITKAVTGSGIAFTPTGGANAGLDDGIAFDPATGMVYISPDGSTTIYQYTAAGAPVTSFPWAGTGGCYNSGLAMAGNYLYEGADGCSTVYAVNKVPAPPSVVGFSFTTSVPGDPNARDEDLECDDVTFASSGLEVLWSKEAYAPMRAAAFEVPAGSCRQQASQIPTPPDSSTCESYGILVTHKDLTGAVGDVEIEHSESATEAHNDTTLSPEATPHPQPIPSPAAHAQAQQAGFEYDNALLGLDASVSLIHSWCDSGFIGKGEPDAYGRAGIARAHVELNGATILDAKAIEFEAEAINYPAGVSWWPECEIASLDVPPAGQSFSYCPAPNTQVSAGVGGVSVTVTLNEQFAPSVSPSGEIVLGGAAVHIQVKSAVGQEDIWLGLVYICLTGTNPPPPPPECPVIGIGGGDPVQGLVVGPAAGVPCGPVNPCDVIAIAPLCDEPPCDVVINVLGESYVVRCHEPPVDCSLFVNPQLPVIRCKVNCDEQPRGLGVAQAPCIVVDPCTLVPCQPPCVERVSLSGPVVVVSCGPPVDCSLVIAGKDSSLACETPQPCGVIQQVCVSVDCTVLPQQLARLCEEVTRL